MSNVQRTPTKTKPSRDETSNMGTPGNQIFSRSNVDVSNLQNIDTHFAQRNTKRSRERDCDCEQALNMLTSRMEELISKLENKQEAIIMKQDDKFEKILGNFNNSITEVKQKNEEILASINFLSKQYDDLKTKLDTLEKERNENQDYVLQLENKIENLERKFKSTSIEFRNVPVRKPETKDDLLKMVKDAGTSLNTNIETADIRDVFRISTKNPETKPVIVEFNSAIIKDKVIQASKTFNKSKKGTDKLNTKHLGLEGPTKPVFISESLTQKAKKLFFLARDFAKAHDFNFCWSSHGKIFLRKREGSPQFQINSETDLKKLIK